MKLSTRARYGTRALVDLAYNADGEKVKLKDIALRQHIPLQYLEQIITPFLTAGIVMSTRGRGGGITLLKKPTQIKLSQIIQLLEGTITPVECVAHPELCPRVDWCSTHDTWCNIQKAIDDILETTTLQDLVDVERKKIAGHDSESTDL
jgi:Rrf2 family cysteine metabolism transcriptional repressor